MKRLSENTKGNIRALLVALAVIGAAILMNGCCQPAPSERMDAGNITLRYEKFDLEGVTYYWVWSPGTYQCNVVCPSADKAKIDE